MYNCRKRNNSFETKEDIQKIVLEILNLYKDKETGLNPRIKIWIIVLKD